MRTFRQRAAGLACVGAAVLLLTAAAARAETYWVNYDPPADGIDTNWLPEVCCGWARDFGNGNGGPPGDLRWIEEGCFVIDSRGDGWSYDCAKRSGPIAPGPQQVLIVEWRLLVAQSLGFSDTTVHLAGDVSEDVVFVFRQDRILSLNEPGWYYLFTPGQFHTFRLVSADVCDGAPYRLWMDGAVIRDGYWIGPTGDHSFVAFGDDIMGPGEHVSLTYWDFFRYGIVRLGDVNRDDCVDFDDINPLVDALSMTEAEFQAQHPDWTWLAGDCNQDGQVDFDDIDPFVGLLAGASGP